MLQTDRSNDLHCSVRVSLWGSNFFCCQNSHLRAHALRTRRITRYQGHVRFFFYKNETVLIVNFFLFFFGYLRRILAWDMNFLIRGLLAPANFLLDVMRGVPSFKKKQLSLWGSIFFVASQLRMLKLYIFFLLHILTSSAKKTILYCTGFDILSLRQASL